MLLIKNVNAMSLPFLLEFRHSIIWKTIFWIIVTAQHEIVEKIESNKSEATRCLRLFNRINLLEMKGKEYDNKFYGMKLIVHQIENNINWTTKKIISATSSRNSHLIKHTPTIGGETKTLSTDKSSNRSNPKFKLNLAQAEAIFQMA